MDEQEAVHFSLELKMLACQKVLRFNLLFQKGSAKGQ